MLNNVVDIINSMDFLNLFGFFPKLKIQKKECYKSDLGAIVFLVYFVTFWYYVISVTIDYINSFDEVDTVKILTDDTTNYYISVNDIYFGIGIISPTTQKMLNIYDYPGLEFGLQFVKMNSEGKNSIQINLTKCDVTLFFSNNDWNNLTSDRQKYLSNDLSFYLCPDTNSFSKMLIPYQYLQNYSYYQFYVKADNDSVLNSTLKNLSMSKPRVQFIWSAVSIDSKVKDIPYKTFIDFFQSSFHSTEFEEIDIFLNANSIYDDDNRLNSGYTVYKNNNYSTQAMGEIFTVSKIEYHTIDQYSRIIPTGSNETDHLYFQKIKINLSKNFIKIYRNYSKFVDFLASTTALTSNILFFLIILMDYINSILAKHILLKTLFSSNSIKRLQEFEDDFKKVLNEDKKEETNKMLIVNEENIQKITLNKIETKEKDINQRNQIISQDKLLGYEDISPICVKLPKDAKIIKNSVLYEKEIDFDFQFIHEIRSCFCIKDKKNLIYKNASESLDNSIDIETLITKNNEVEMIKKFLLMKIKLRYSILYQDLLQLLNFSLKSKSLMKIFLKKTIGKKLIKF